MRIATIASGSSGNCTYIGSDTTHLLVDAGVSMKRIAEGLRGLELSIADIDGVFVTHEHSDHIQGLPILEKHYGRSIWATPGTAEGILAADARHVIDRGLISPIRPGDALTIGDLTVRPFAVSHDAREPVGFTVSQDCGGRKKKVAVATDLGRFDGEIVEALSGLDALVLEANHDVRMLEVGPYPYHLKQRILGEGGHLSNDAAGELLTRILHDGFQGVLLGHLSDKNNLPELAYETVRVEVELSETPYHGTDFLIEVAPRSELSRVLKLE